MVRKWQLYLLLLVFGAISCERPTHTGGGSVKQGGAGQKTNKKDTVVLYPKQKFNLISWCDFQLESRNTSIVKTDEKGNVIADTTIGNATITIKFDDKHIHSVVVDVQKTPWYYLRWFVYVGVFVLLIYPFWRYRKKIGKFKKIEKKPISQSSTSENLNKELSAVKKENEILINKLTESEKKVTNLQKGNQNNTSVKQNLTLTPEELENVFKWILNDNQNFFSTVILKNEQYRSLWIKNSLKYPTIREILEKEFLQKIEQSPFVVQQKERSDVVPEIKKPSETPTSILYANSIADDFFNRVTEEVNANTIFELHVQNSQNATFTIHSSAKQKIIANPAFLGGCDKQVLANASNVEVTDKGIAQRQADGRWKIIRKLNVIVK